MPGFSEACVSGQHQGCTEGINCRCTCHSTTQELIRKGPKKGNPKGGIRRKLKNKITEAVQNLPVIDAEPEAELHNTCPQCGAVAKPTDTFCRKDGSRLLMGKQCLGCGAPAEPDDVHCWSCGLKCGEKPPEPEHSETPVQELTERDRLMLLRAKARELGLLPKETVVS